MIWGFLQSRIKVRKYCNFNTHFGVQKGGEGGSQAKVQNLSEKFCHFNTHFGVQKRRKGNQPTEYKKYTKVAIQGPTSKNRLSSETFPKVWPLPLFYLGNLVFGLGSTQVLSLPMMTVLRRFSILMTLIGSSICLSFKTNDNV